MEESTVTEHHRWAPAQYRGEGEVWYRDEQVATVMCLLGVYAGTTDAETASDTADPDHDTLDVKGGSVQLVSGHIPCDGEELLMVCSEGRSFRFVATHKVDRVYRITPVEQ